MDIGVLTAGEAEMTSVLPWAFNEDKLIFKNKVVSVLRYTDVTGGQATKSMGC